MKMVDLGEKMGDEIAPSAPHKKEKYYPRIYLGTDQTKALGLADAEAGAELTMVARVRVTSIQSSEHEGGKKHVSVDLSIERAVIEPPKKDVAQALYPDQGK